MRPSHHPRDCRRKTPVADLGHQTCSANNKSGQFSARSAGLLSRFLLSSEVGANLVFFSLSRPLCLKWWGCSVLLCCFVLIIKERSENFFQPSGFSFSFFKKRQPCWRLVHGHVDNGGAKVVLVLYDTTHLRHRVPGCQLKNFICCRA